MEGTVIATPRATAHAGIEPSDVVDAALRMVEEGGPGALTMRKLAAELDVAVTSIYWHVGQRDEVVAAVLAVHRERLRDLAVSGDSAEERIFSAAKNIWDSSLRHANLTRLAHQAGVGDLGQPLVDVLLVEVARSSLDPPEAAVLVRMLISTVAGFLVQALRADSTMAPGLTLGRVAEEGTGAEYVEAVRRSVDLESTLDDALRRLIRL